MTPLWYLVLLVMWITWRAQLASTWMHASPIITQGKLWRGNPSAGHAHTYPPWQHTRPTDRPSIFRIPASGLAQWATTALVPMRVGHARCVSRYHPPLLFGISYILYLTNHCHRDHARCVSRYPFLIPLFDTHPLSIPIFRYPFLRCISLQGPCAVGEYLDGCGDGPDNSIDATCTGCTNKDGTIQSNYTSAGTIAGLIGNNDCTWRCNADYYGATVGTGVSRNATGGECQACNMDPCAAGSFRDICYAGRTLDASCLNCAAAPLFSTLGTTTPYNQDNCQLICNEGWIQLPGSRFCCSDNSYIVAGGGSCTCSAGFRIGPTDIDGADCVP